VSKYVTVSADPGVANLPIGGDVTIRFTAHKKVVKQTHCGWENSIRTYVVTMGYVEEEPAFFRQEIFDSAQGLNSA
jgi:hypothetical protein